LTKDGSLNEYIDKAVRRYSSLFTLPSHKILLSWLLATCMVAGILTTNLFQLSPVYWLSLGLTIGLILFVLALASDFIIYSNSVKTDPIFNLRRCTALDLYSLVIWVVFILFGIISNLFVAGVWFKFFILGFCVALALRLLVFSAVSFAGTAKTIVFSLLQPVMYVVTVVYTASAISGFRAGASLLAFLFLSIIITAATMSLYIFSINQVGSEILGVGSFSVLKAFMANWTEDVSAPFERLFERFSKESEIRLSAVSFRNAKGMIKATVIVPAFHPGPFKNVGSSALPYAIQSALEKKLRDCVVLVPHGLSGHNLDLATQTQNQIVLNRVLELSDISNFGASVTQFLRVKRNGASAGCQVFNGCALLSLTMAPETMEDLPSELNMLINEAADENGLSGAIAIDAHNSIEGPFKTDGAIKPLQEAATKGIERASKCKQTTFQVGAAKVTPKEFGLQEGIGPGGIVVLVVKVEDQTTAYVIIDGNNMISGLREKILNALHEDGVKDGEIFTTDTHMVNAVVLTARGYHPVGEAVDQEILIGYVRRAAMEAVRNLEPAEVGWRTCTVQGVKVIGGEQIEAMSTLLDKAMKRAKKLAVSVFPIAGLILAALFLFL
jgi:putative membrane protein